jgi:hypothetical protein
MKEEEEEQEEDDPIELHVAVARDIMCIMILLPTLYRVIKKALCT